WDAFEEFNQKAKTSTILGFKFDTEKVVTQMSAVSNTFKEFIKPLYTGSVETEETLEKLNKKLYDSGLEDIKVELQRQLDEWKKENK
ncbi:MAG: DUF3502 domain-containing protein, partial [Clostridium perfringens]|nr:DUF3502 domain-containing protein [Clostridium perfringens]